MRLLQSFAPWVLLFFLLDDPFAGWEIVGICVWAIFLIFNFSNAIKGNILDIFSGVYFTAFFIWTLIKPFPFLVQEVWVSNVALGVVTGLTVVLRQPFTFVYAKQKVSQEIAISGPFFKINCLLSGLWSLVFILMGIPGVVEMIRPYREAYLWGLGVNVVLIVIGVILSALLPPQLVKMILKKRFYINIKKQYAHAVKERKPIPEQQEEPGPCEKEVDVVIVGGGPNGLASALLLQKQGLKPIVIEKHPGLSKHPKARSLSCRSMELLRKLGLEKKIKEYSIAKDQQWFGWFHSLVQPCLATMSPKIEYAEISPTQGAEDVAQPYVEQVLYQAFIEGGGEVFFQHRLTHLIETEDKVQLEICDSEQDRVYRVNSKYVVAADGVRSCVRSLFHIDMIGPQEINAMVSVYCEIDLDHVVSRKNRCGFALFIHEDGPSPIMMSIDGKNKWVIIFPSPQAPSEKIKQLYTPQYVNKRIAEIVGHEVDVNILSLQVWMLGSQVANRFQTSRVFLVGDSAHQFSPTGGMGLNTGLQDVDNLMWKIAYVIQGKASAQLLKTYSMERIPSVLNNMQWSLDILYFLVMLQRQNIPKLIKEGKFQKHVDEQAIQANKSGIDLGTIYQSFCISSKVQPPKTEADEYVPRTFAGARLPHIELTSEGKNFSSLDLVDTSFMLVLYEQDRDKAQNIQFSTLPTNLIVLGKEIQEVAPGTFSNLVALPHPAVWVRPDGHIAWRGSLSSSNDLQALQDCIEAHLAP